MLLECPALADLRVGRGRQMQLESPALGRNSLRLSKPAQVSRPGLCRRHMTMATPHVILPLIFGRSATETCQVTAARTLV